MLFLTGLLTLLAIAQAGGDHIKGGVKGGSVTQQKIAQEDIIPSPFNVKSAATFGSKVISQDATDPLSKTVRVPGLHHSVKTAAATSPVLQDQVVIEDPASDGIKNLKTAATGKTSFSQQDGQVRDPIARPVVQTIKSASADSVKGIKTLNAGSRPVADAVVRTVKTVQDSTVTRQIKTVKTISTGKTAIPDESLTSSNKGIKTLGSPSTQNRFLREDTQVRDPIARPVVQTVQIVEDPSIVGGRTLKTTTKTAEPSNLRTKSAVKTSQSSIDSPTLYNNPVSIVESARRNTLRSSTSAGTGSIDLQRSSQSSSQLPPLNLAVDSLSQPGPELGSNLGDIILDEETLQTLQNAGGIINENGQISLNEEGIKILQSIRGTSILQYSAAPQGTGISSQQGTARVGQDSSGSIVRNPEFTASRTILSQTQRGSIQKTSTNPSLRIRPNSLQTGGVLNAGSASFSAGNQALNPGVRIQGERLPLNSASRSSNTGTSSRVGITTSSVVSNAGGRPLASGISQGQRSPQVTGSAAAGGSLTSGTVLFNGKEISIEGLNEGQLFDENLRPILPESSPTVFGNSRTLSNSIIGTTTSREASPRRRVQPQQQSLAGGLRSSVATTTSRGTAPRPRVQPQQQSQAGGLRSSVLTTSSRGIVSNRIAPARLTPQSPVNIRTASVTTNVASPQQSPLLRGVTSGNSLTSGTVLFNGQEISVEGLKEGQIFDENLRPIMTGASGILDGTSNIVPGSPQINEIPAVSFGSRILSAQRSQPEAPLSRLTPRVNTESLRISSIQTSNQPSTEERPSAFLSGSVLFNGNEINIEGLRERQIFDENLRPILSESSDKLSANPAVLSVPPGSNIAPVNSALKPLVPYPQRSSTGSLRSAIPGSSSSSIRRPESVGAGLLRQTQNIRAGVSRTNVPKIPSPQITGAVRSSGSLASDKVIFNGKEISLDGLKAGQLFDENLRPITDGTSNSLSENPSAFLGSLQSRGASFGSVVPKPNVRPPQRTQMGVLRSSVTRSSSRTAVGGSGLGAQLSLNNVRDGSSRTSISGLRPSVITAPRGAVGSLRIPGSQSSPQSLPNVRTGPLTTSVFNAQRISSTAGIAASRGTSGSVLFNGKQISIDGLKEGQLFDENLNPILPGTSNILAEKSATLSGSPLINSAITESSASRSRGTSSQRSQTGVLRSSVITSSSTGSISNLRPATVSSQRLTPQVRSGISATSLSSAQRRVQAARGTTSGGSLTSGTALFNGKEIRIDGLKEGQLFDENLQPIITGIQNIAPKSPTLSSVSQRNRVPSSIAAPKPRVRTSQTSQLGVSRSSVSTASRGTINNSITSDAQFLQSNQNIRGGSLATRVSSPQRIPQVATGIRSSSSFSSGSALFNGKEISIEGLKEGQLFDENLKPIVQGIPGSVAKKSGVFPDSLQSTGVSARGVTTRTRVRQQQSSVAGGLRSFTIPSSPRSPVSASRSPAASPILTSPNLRAGPSPLRAVSPQNIAEVDGRIASVGSLTSGTVLFNGKEISIDGLKEGQLFDENLQPILSGTSGIVAEKSSVLPGSDVRGISTISAPKPPVRSTQRQQAAGLRSSTVTTSSRNVVRGTVSSSTFPSPNLRAGSLTTGISSTQRRTQTVAGATSGTALFNGKEISIEGLKEGQLFDENLRPIVSENSVNLLGSSQISGVSSRNVVPSRRTSTQQQARQPTGFRSSVISSSTRRTVDRSRTASTLSVIPSPNVRTATSVTGISSPQINTQGVTRTRSDVSLTSGSVLFNGKEISIDGLKEGQLFDENLRPIPSGTATAVESGLLRQPEFGYQRPATAGIRTSGANSVGGSLAASGLRGQSVLARGSQEGTAPLGLIDVTRSEEPQPFSRSSLNNPSLGRQTGVLRSGGISRLSSGPASSYAGEYGSRGSNAGDKINRDSISQYGIEAPIVQESLLNAPDIQRKIHESDPDTFRTAQVQQPVPFSVSDSQKTVETKISQVSQKNVDIPITQQKFLGEDISSYLPKTSFLPPFNYALPQLSASKYRVKTTPVVQEQQKVEQIFV